MRPFVEINGVDSRTVDGLLITSIPPITKAPIRTERTEIEGRDGDIIERLGYSSYDRPLEIGLYGNYNVDDVISYFQTEGDIIFSNEPDKVYKFAVYDQIDFERLIRFKTATVNIHCQPFKYSATEESEYTGSRYNRSKISLNVRNNGNIYAQPTIYFYGKGNVKVVINGETKIEVKLGTATLYKITINSEEFNAVDEYGNLVNRYIKGDYEDLVLPIGDNEVTVNGTVRQLRVSNYSRWI